MDALTLQQVRRNYIPVLPKIFSSLTELVFHAVHNPSIQPEIQKLFPLTSGFSILKGEKKAHKPPSKPLKVGVVFSGGQAAGGHNVISGLYDALKSLDRHSQLLGFIDGPAGIVSGKYKELTDALIDPYRNQGGFDLIGSGRTKIETEEQFSASLERVRSLKLDGLVIIGGDDSHTNAALLAEYFLKNACPVRVLGVPKTIDGDLKNPYVATSFGFDTACKTYSEMIGNIAHDVLSAKKYYHFIRLMGRSASHIALECALSTQPNFTCIGEEIAAKKKTWNQTVLAIADMICRRAELSKHYGIILVPEGLIEFIPEIGSLIKELNGLLAGSSAITPQDIEAKLTPPSRACYSSLPEDIQKQLLLHRDPHGNVQVSFIETEKFLMQLVEKELLSRQSKGSYSGKFNAVNHFFGYEGRAGFPSNFDSNYCYALGYTAALLVNNGVTGYMCSIQNLSLHPSEWQIGAVPLTSLMNMEMRKGKERPVVQKALLDLNSKAFAHFSRQREDWAIDDTYLYPGPIQFFGPSALCDTVPQTLILEK
jgi:diphosphate-dependent phosphofructokinase